MRTALLLSLVVIASSVACGGEADQNVTGPSSVGGHTLEITEVRAGRWAQSGNYTYNVSYRITNSGGVDATYDVRDLVLLGPDGETLPGYKVSDFGRSVAVSANSTQPYGRFSVDGADPGHPYAERLRLRMDYRTAGGKSGILTVEAAVPHEPQSARLLEFSMTPPGFDPGAATVAEAPLGQPIVVRWRVTNASVVVLESTVPIPPTGGPLFSEQVEHAGSRSLIPLRTGLQSVELNIDNGRIRKFVFVAVR